jgi:hypothetical protein
MSDLKDPSDVNPSVKESRQRTPVENPLVFISHDSRDAELAEAFANLLTDASGGILKSFRSSDRKGTAGIEFGSEWYRAIMEKLDGATDVVALLTPRSINRPWILYESGVAKGKLGTTVLGLAIGVRLDDAATGPFAQFQNSGDDEDSLTKLVLQLIRRHPQASPREEAVRRQVAAFLEVIKKAMANLKPEPTHSVSRVDESSVAKLFEEVKILVRDVPDRVSSQMDGRRRRGLRNRGFHPAMIQEFFERSALRDHPTGVLIFASMLRDDLPWIYELATEYYRTSFSGNDRQVLDAQRVFRDTLKIFRHNEFIFEFIDSDESLIMLDELIHHMEFVIGRTQTDSKPTAGGLNTNSK